MSAASAAGSAVAAASALAAAGVQHLGKLPVHLSHHIGKLLAGSLQGLVHGPGFDLLLHFLQLPGQGVHLIEIMDLDALARDGVKEFCFIGLPLKIKGTTGAWIRPVALA